jgi:hypothetical protein
VLINSIFRPLLTVVGLVFSSVMMAVLAQFVDNTFVFAVNNSSGSSWFIDPFDAVAILTLMMYLHYQVCIRSLRLITLLPDAVLAWIGGQARNLSYGDLMDAESGHREFIGGFASKTTNNISPPKPQQKAAVDPNGPKPPGVGGGGEDPEAKV